jgi:hypothetical protein
LGLEAETARPSTERAWPWLAALGALAACAALLRWQGRAWLCACGHVRVWTNDAWSAETSQQLFDPYSLTHVLHGVALCGLLWLIATRLARDWRFALAVALEASWEVIENSEAVIRRYREGTAALGYEGDTVINSLGDIAACAAGFLAARRLGPWRSLALFVAAELLLVFWIKDSLLLNVIMLIHPVEAIKEWQSAH